MLKKITLQMIADKVGVSKALVSKALSHDPAVSDITKEAIWNTAEEMGYKIKAGKKNASGAGYAGRTGNFAVLLPRAYLGDIEYWGKILQGIDKEFSARGVSMILAGIDINMKPDEGMPSSIEDHKVDGALVLGHMPEGYVSRLKASNVPFVMVDSNLLDPKLDHVLANNFLGAYDAVRRLLSAGHRRVGFVGNAETAWSFRERSRGFQEAVKDFMDASGETVTAEWIRGIGVSGNGNFARPEFVESLRGCLQSDTPVTALFCANDMLAFEVLKHTGEWGVDCPGQLSIVGFDDLTLTEFMNPKLSTVRVLKESIGARAARMILEKVEEPGTAAEHILVSTEYVERASVQSL